MSDKLKTQVLQSIRDASDDDAAGTHALIEMNPDENGPKFYIVITTNTHEGRDYLNIRYFRYNQKYQTGTFLKNGINIRHEAGVTETLTEALEGVDERALGFERDEPSWYSIKDDGAE